MSKYQYLVKWVEPFVFYSMCIIGVWSLLWTKYLFSIDGAAHVYSAHIILDLLLNPDSIFKGIYTINPYPVPNWLGHAFLTLFIPFVGGITAEKLLVIFIVLSTPITARLFIRSYFGNVLPSYLFIFVAHHYLLYLGFYNYSLGIPLIFIALNLLNNYLKHAKMSTVIWIGVLHIALYFSHLFVLFAALGLQCTLLIDYFLKNEKGFSQLSGLKLIRLTLAFIPTALLALLFLINSNSITNDKSYSLEELYKRFLELDFLQLSFTITPLEPFKTFEDSIWTLIGIILLGWLTRALIHKNTSFFKVNFWLVATMVTALGYFFIPDMGIYLMERLFLLFFICLILWLCSFKIYTYTSLIFIPLAFFIQREMQFSALAFRQDTQHDVADIVDLSSEIPKNSMVATYNFSDYWLQGGHNHNYIGLQPEVVDVYNYEAILNYFPLAYALDPNQLLSSLNEERPILAPLSFENKMGEEKDIGCIVIIRDKSANKSHKEKREFFIKRGYQLKKSNDVGDLLVFSKEPQIEN